VAQLAATSTDYYTRLEQGRISPSAPLLASLAAERNFVRLLFTDPRLRSLYPEWEELARAVVSYLRMEAARKPDDPRLAALVGDLSIRDAQFRQRAKDNIGPS
jgi:MmyB-like transcription regulator ligand binding domain